MDFRDQHPLTARHGFNMAGKLADASSVDLWEIKPARVVRQCIKDIRDKETEIKDRETAETVKDNRDKLL